MVGHVAALANLVYDALQTRGDEALCFQRIDVAGERGARLGVGLVDCQVHEDLPAHYFGRSIGPRVVSHTGLLPCLRHVRGKVRHCPANGRDWIDDIVLRLDAAGGAVRAFQPEGAPDSSRRCPRGLNVCWPARQDFGRDAESAAGAGDVPSVRHGDTLAPSAASAGPAPRIARQPGHWSRPPSLRQKCRSLALAFSNDFIRSRCPGGSGNRADHAASRVRPDVFPAKCR
jgi:hypothetical protein